MLTHVAANLYDARYECGYMETWPDQKKATILELVRGLQLPHTGEALDFGCGNGVLTEVLRQALHPGWAVYGTDVSARAIANAKSWYRRCRFFLPSDREFMGRKFDFVFTHHVLEHVNSLDEVLDSITSRLKPGSVMLHVLPCGNEGSFEHNLCKLHKHGFKPGGMFFFEDEAHLRRLTTDQLCTLWGQRGFSMTSEFYRNQHHGALNWITHTHSPGFIGHLTAPDSARDEQAAKVLRALRYRLLFYWAVRYPVVRWEESLRKKRRRWKDYLFLALGMTLYPFSKPMDAYLNRNDKSEWERSNTRRNGSEMYLCFRSPEYRREEQTATLDMA